MKIKFILLIIVYFSLSFLFLKILFTYSKNVLEEIIYSILIINTGVAFKNSIISFYDYFFHHIFINYYFIHAKKNKKNAKVFLEFI